MNKALTIWAVLLLIFGVTIFTGILLQPKSTHAEEANTQSTVIDTPTPKIIPNPTISPQKIVLENSLQDVNQEIDAYQEDIVTYQEKYNDLYNSMYNNTSATPVPCGNTMQCVGAGESPMLLMAEYGYNIRILNSFTARINNDSEKLDELHQEKDQLEYQIAQL